MRLFDVSSSPCPSRPRPQANIGWYSALFALFNYSVYAVEPMKTNREVIHTTSTTRPTRSHLWL